MAVLAACGMRQRRAGHSAGVCTKALAADAYGFEIDVDDVGLYIELGLKVWMLFLETSRDAIFRTSRTASDPRTVLSGNASCCLRCVPIYC